MKNTLTLVMVLLTLYASEPKAKIHHIYHKHSIPPIKKIVKHDVSKGESGRHLTKNDKQPLSDYQRNILNTAYTIAKRDGIKKPEILSGIILQESKAGLAPKFRTSKHKSAKDQTVGLSQLKDSTARAILKQFPELKTQYKINEDKLHEALANNDEFNIAIASKYIKMLYDQFKSDDMVIAAFNMGPAGVKKVDKPWKLEYVKYVRNHILRHKLNTILS